MRAAVEPLFESADDVPDFYVTMGPASIMRARHLVLIASGEKKAAIMKTWFETNVDERIPASILKLHPNITVIMDRDAGALCEK
jgi:6-phosphogluconolactonase/glucosamine-6-phosphate isomerase/deaminase